MSDNLRQQSFSQLSKTKKTVFVFLLLITIGIFVVWVWQFNARVNKPFQISSEDAKRMEDNYQALVATDTDGDGLLDSDETNIYKTSPYLEDTDGDGINDGEEISSGKDPLCPEGQNCNISSESVINDATTTVEIPNFDEPVTTTTSDNAAANVDEALLIKALNGEGDAAILREVLLQSGADKAMLDKISDAELMASYQSVLDSQGSLATSTANNNLSQ